MNLSIIFVIVPLLVVLVLFIWKVDEYKEQKVDKTLQFEVIKHKKNKVDANAFLIPKT